MERFSVLMSVYKKENPEYLETALKSIYEEQKLKPDEIILVQDGPLTEELYKKIDKYILKYNNILKIIPLKKNVGLGNALNKGIEACKNELIARMDTDDISFPERFKVQIEYMLDNKEVAVLGTSLLEFEGDIQNIISEKKAPKENIEKYIKFRNPLNHPTVIFRKSKVLEAGNYQEIKLFEDYYLWARMKAKGFKIANLENSLLYFRTSSDMYRRRGGLAYVRAELELQKKFLQMDFINHLEYIRNIVIRNIGRIIPNELRKILYLKFLRRKNKG